MKTKIAPVLAETPVTQCSPCYSAVSTSLINPLPDCSIAILPHPLPHSPDQYFTSLGGQTLYQAALLETNTSLLQRYTAESSQELMSFSEEYLSALKLNNKQRQVVMFLLLFKLSSQLPFVSISFLTVSILSLLPFLISPSPSTIPFSSDQLSVLLR